MEDDKQTTILQRYRFRFYYGIAFGYSRDIITLGEYKKFILEYVNFLCFRFGVCSYIRTSQYKLKDKTNE